MSRIINLEGMVFGKLTVIGRDTDLSNLPTWKLKQPQWICKCECGNVTTKHGRYLRDGDTQSCGCKEMAQRKITSKNHFKHGETGSTEYYSWQAMKTRCYNINSPKYSDYGGRGVLVCERWLHSFENFFEDMGVKPSKLHTLDRFPNNDGNYEPNNCRWGTPNEQTRNKRNNHWVEHEGKKMIMNDWAKYFKVNQSSLYGILKRKSFSEVYNYYKIKNGILNN